MIAFDETAFLREGIGIQPFQQVGGIGADHLHLREMQMRIDEAGQQEMRAMVDLDRIGLRLRPHRIVCAAGEDFSVLDQQGAVFLISIAGVVVEAFRPAVEAEGPAAQKD